MSEPESDRFTRRKMLAAASTAAAAALAGCGGPSGYQCVGDCDVADVDYWTDHGLFCDHQFRLDFREPFTGRVAVYPRGTGPDDNHASEHQLEAAEKDSLSSEECDPMVLEIEEAGSS